MKHQRLPILFLATLLFAVLPVSGLPCQSVTNASGSVTEYTLFLNSSGDAALVWDRDSDGVVDAADLFGGRGLTGRDVDNAFEDLALLDINGDGLFNVSDDNFTTSSLKLWILNSSTQTFDLILFNTSIYNIAYISLAYRDKVDNDAYFWDVTGTFNSSNYTRAPVAIGVNLTTTNGHPLESDFLVLDLDNTTNITVANTTGCGAAAASSSSSGSSKPKTWADLFIEDERELREKGTITLSVNKKDRIRLRIDGAVHVVDVVEFTEGTATINVSSKTQQAVLRIGEEKKFDVDEDNFYDLLVKLSSIASSKVSLAFSAVHEAIVEDTPPPSVTAVADPEPQPVEQAPAPTPVADIPETAPAPVQADQTTSSNKWVIIAAVLVVLVATVVYVRKSILAR